MAAPLYTCNLNQLMVNSKCFKDPCLSATDRKGLDIHFKVRNLMAIGGTNYAANLSALMKDSAAWRHRAKHELDAIDLWIDWQNALDNGAVLELTPNALAAATKCVRNCVGIEDLNGVLSYLKCSINTLGKPD